MAMTGILSWRVMWSDLPLRKIRLIVSRMNWWYLVTRGRVIAMVQMRDEEV